MYDTIEEERRLIAGSSATGQNDGEEHEPPERTTPDTQPSETVHIHYFPDAIVICKEGQDYRQEDTVIAATLVEPKQPPVFIAYAVCLCYLLLILSCIAFQVYALLNPPIATVTIVPQSQTLTLTGTLQLGRLLNPLTISQSQTVPTTGRGHQDAKHASGTITLYNGQFQSVTLAAGTVLTGGAGVQIITDQDAIIPAANPPTFGQTTVSAQAIRPGSTGNIPAYDINGACCAASVLAKNTHPFSGDQDERDFQAVAKADISSVATPLKTTVAQSMSAAMQSQLTPQEQMSILPCTPTVTSDHQIGQAATTVTVSVSETCSAVAYNREELQQKATDLLTRQAVTRAGTAYSLIGNTNVRVTQATITRATTPLVFLSFQASGTWVYALSRRTQQQLKTRIAGKTKQEALHLLRSVPGIASAAISWGDESRLPKNTGYIHLTLVVV